MDEYVTRRVRHMGSWGTIFVDWPKATVNWLKREDRKAGIAPSEFLRRAWINGGVLSVPGEVGQTVTVRFKH